MFFGREETVSRSADTDRIVQLTDSLELVAIDGDVTPLVVVLCNRNNVVANKSRISAKLFLSNLILS